jgi:hypothetical protein
VTQEAIREALDPSTGNPHPHPADSDPKMNIFYTSDADPQGSLGSIALVMDDRTCSMWRFRDSPKGSIDLASARKWARKVW